MRRFIRPAMILGSVLLLLTGCSVYAPLQPGALLIQRKGEAEVAASGYLSGRLEGSAAYSPLNRVVVRVAGGLKTGGGDSTFFRIRQLEAGVGTYRNLGSDWVLGGMVGYGGGRSSRRFRDGGFESFADTVRTRDYAARFRKAHVELYVVRDKSRLDYGGVSYGGAIRLAQVYFTSLTDKGTPVPLRRMTRVEPMVFLCLSNPELLPWAQLRLTGSLSASPDERTRSSGDERIRNLKEGRLFTSLGFTIYPHRFKQ